MRLGLQVKQLLNRPLVNIIALALFALIVSGCADRADRFELPQAAHVEVYHGAWEYRYGNSPQRSDGTWLWADPAHEDGKWLPTTKFSNPPGRGSSQYLWLRTRMVGPSLHDATLLLPAEVYQSLEGFVDGQMITRFGSLEGPAARRFMAKRPIYLPLGPSYSGRTLALRFYSPTWSIGFLSLPMLGGRAEMLVYVAKQGLPYIVIGVLFIVLGLGVLFFYFFDRRQQLYLLYALVSLVIGTYQVCRSPMRGFLFEEPSVWRYIEITSLCLLPAAVAAFLSRLSEKGPFRAIRWISWVSIVYFFVGTALTVSGRVHFEYLVLILIYLIVLFFVVFAVVSVIAAWSGSQDWRILAAGFFISAALGLYASLQSLSIVRQVIDTRHYSACVFVLTLGVVLARRFRAFNKQLADYSTVLQLSFSSAQDLTPGHQAQIALAELLRMLQAQRGLLFLCKPDGTELDLVAGRDAQGNALRDPTTSTGYDQKLITAVLQKRQPFVREFTHQAAELDSRKERRVAMAAPLLARGQLLGVIYLEADSARLTFGRRAVEILLGLSSQVALSMMATRAGRLEHESVQVRQRLEEQGALLAVAARMARGDLESPISVAASSELAPLAQALDSMRLDLRAKIDMLESSNAAVQQLNKELRFQIDQRLRSLLETAQSHDAAAEIPMTARTGAAGLVADELLGEHYRIVGLLGEGTTGSVYEVERTTDGRHLAAKVLNSRADKTVSLRFTREAQILARLSHPNVVAIVDVELTRDGILFLVMELLRGIPLHRCQQRYGDYSFALAVLRQIADGLRIVHERGIIHRDLKPANVIVSEPEGPSAGSPQVKLVDFGISSLSASAAKDPSSASLRGLGEESGSHHGQTTAAGVILGTPMYLAPELAQGSANATPASDVFSFGVIAYELLSAEMPFAEPPVVTYWRGQPLSIPSLRGRCSKFPQLVLQLVEQCLEPEPAQRPTVEQILAVLKAEPGPTPAGADKGAEIDT